MTTIASKTVLLTGASRGLGALIARELAQEHALIVGVSRSQAGLDTVGATVEAAGGQWRGVAWDISQVETLPDLMHQVQEQTGGVDILINNAGIERYRAFQDCTLADIQAVLSTNLVAAMELSRLVLPTLLSRGRGHIVNMASMAAKKGHPYDSLYSASKAGLLMWGDALRQELVGTGVEISTICPGYISGQGMLADTGLPAPALAGTSTPEAVARRVIRAIQRNQPEVLVNKDPVTERLTQGLFALWQYFPTLGDAFYRWIGVTDLNQKRIQSQTPTPSPQEQPLELNRR